MKRIRALVLSIVLLISSFAYIPTSYAVEADSSVLNIELLNMLGFIQGYEDGELHPENSITRTEYAALILRSLSYEDFSTNSYKGIFNDVSTSFWGSGYIQAAYELGLIDGYGNGNFGPQDNIKKIDAVKIIVNALGYRHIAEKNGGYPTGYIIAAKKIGIINSVAEQDSLATREFVSELIVHSLEVEFGTNGEDLNYELNETICTRNNIERRNGYLQATKSMQIIEADDLEDDQIIVSNELFKCTCKIADELVGKNIDVYVRDYNTSDAVVVAVVGRRKGKEDLTIYSEDIEDGTNFSQIVYRVNGKKRSVSLPENININYNGKQINNSIDYNVERLKPKNGYVKLVDSLGTGEYDVAVVKEYDTYVLNQVTSDTIYDAYGNYHKIDWEEDSVSVYLNDTTSQWDEMKSGDILSVAVSLDGTITEIIICREKVSGIVESYFQGDKGLEYTLDNGYELRLSSEYQTALQNNLREAEPINLNDEVTISLNSFGEISYVVKGEASAKESKYGYLVDAGSYGNGISGINSYQILTDENVLEIFDVPSRNKMFFGRMEDGNYQISRESGDYIINYMTDYTGFNCQMIMYELDDEGTLKRLLLKDDNTNSDNPSMDVGRSTKLFAYHTIDGEYYWDEKTVVFHIPGTGRNSFVLSSGKPEDYFNDNKDYLSELWDVEEDGYVNCIVYNKNASGIPTSGKSFWLDYVNSPVMLITDVKNVINDDGIDFKVITGYENKKLVTRILSDTLSSDSTAIRDLNPGTIIQYETNAKWLNYAENREEDETIQVYAVLIDLNDELTDMIRYDYDSLVLPKSRIKFALSSVEKYNAPYLKLSIDNAVHEVHGGTAVYIYDTDSQEFTKGTANDIHLDSKVFVRTRYNNLREVVVVREGN